MADLQQIVDNFDDAIAQFSGKPDEVIRSSVETHNGVIEYRSLADLKSMRKFYADLIIKEGDVTTKRTNFQATNFSRNFSSGARKI